MTDHALDLLAAIGAAVPPLPGGWHAMPLPGGAYPYGTFYITRSKRQAGNAWLHYGIVNVWCRDTTPGNAAAVAVQCYDLSARALEALDGGFPVTGFALHDFLSDWMIAGGERYVLVVYYTGPKGARKAYAHIKGTAILTQFNANQGDAEGLMTASVTFAKAGPSAYAKGLPAGLTLAPTMTAAAVTP